MTIDPLSSGAALAEFIQAFEQGAFPIKHWTHHSHVIMASWYLTGLNDQQATTAIRDGIIRYNLAQGGQNTDTSGYHETLTIFWIRIIRHYLDTLPASLARLDRIRNAAEKFGPVSGLFRDYWSYDLLQSVEARREWRAPDKMPLP